MANNATLTVRILGNARGAIDEVGRLGRSVTGLGKIGLAAGAGLAAVGVGAGAALFKIGESFDNIENTIIRGTGAAGDALDSLVGQAKDVLQTVPDSGQVVAGAIADVNTFFGQTGDRLENSTRQFLDFARVTETDVGRAIASTDALFTQFGENSTNLDETLGDLTRIAQATGAPMDQLLGQLETFGPLFANAGFSIEETAAVFGQLEQAGVDVTRVGPALNKFFRDAAANGEEPRAALSAIVDEIANAEDGTAALNLASEAFGAEGAQRLSNAIRSGNFDLEDFNGLIGDGAGLVAAQAEATETFGDKWNNIKNRVLVGLEPLATRVFDGVGDALDALEPHIETFGVWFEENLPAFIETASEAFEAVRPAIRQIALGIQGAIAAFQGEGVTSGGFVGFMERAGVIIRQVVDFLIENVPPVVQQISAFLQEYVPPIAGFFIDTFGVIVDWFEENWPQIQATITQVLDAVFTVIDTFVTIAVALWGEFGDDILAIVETVWSKLGPIIQGAVDVITGIIDVFASIVSGDWDALWSSLGQVFSGAWAIAEGIITGAFEILKTTIGGILEAIGTVVSEAWDGIVEGVSDLGGEISSAAVGMFDGVKNAFRSAVNFIIDGWNSLEFTIGGGSFLGQDIPSLTLGTPNIPRLADGNAAFAPMFAIVGDNSGARQDPEITAPQSFIREALRDVLDEREGQGGINIEHIEVVERPLLEELNELTVLYPSAA